MSIKSIIVNKINQLKNKAYKPKFKVGDVIYNKKFKIIRKVLEIQTRSELCEMGKQAQYKLEDYKNELKRPHNFKYPTYKTCIAIDDYYEVIDERMVQVLYGKK